MNQRHENIAAVYRKHADALSKLQSNNTVVTNAIRKVNLIASELENNRIIMPVVITEQICRAIWVKIDVRTPLDQRTNASIMRKLVEEFLLLNGFVGPVVEGELTKFHFHTDLTGDQPFKFRLGIVDETIEEYQFFEIKLTREAYSSNGMVRDLSSALCTIKVAQIPPIVDENAEWEGIMLILKRLNTHLRKTFCYLKRENTPTNSTLIDALDVEEEAVGE